MPRIALSFVILATLALPSASALGEEYVAQVYATWDWAAETANAFLAPPAPPEEQPAPEGSTEPAPAEPEEPAAEPAPAAPPAPREDRAAPLAPLAPVTRLAAIPVLESGPAPRIDLGEIQRLAGIAPLEEVAPRAPASAPARVEPASDTALATASAGEVALPILPVAVAAATTVAAAGAAPSASLLWERLRRLGLFAALYSRIAKERILDHGSRERLLETIRARPGLAVADLAAASGLPRNTVTYHLRVLEREGLASSTRNGRNRLFFAPGSLQKREQADALATLRHETSAAMARAIGAEPGVDQKALCARIGLSPSLAHWHADRLVASGLVDKRREGRFVRYYPGAAFALVDARSA